MAVPDMGKLNEIGAKRTIKSCIYCNSNYRIVMEINLYSNETRQYVA